MLRIIIISDDQQILNEYRRDQQGTKLRNLQQKFRNVDKRMKSIDEELKDLDQQLKVIMKGIGDLFKMFKCKNDPLLQLLGKFVMN